MVGGKLGPQQAFLMRKLKIAGSMALAMKLQPILVRGCSAAEGGWAFRATAAGRVCCDSCFCLLLLQDAAAPKAKL